MRGIYAIAGLVVLGVGLAGWAALAWGQGRTVREVRADSRPVEPAPVAPLPEPPVPEPVPPAPTAAPAPLPPAVTTTAPAVPPPAPAAPAVPAPVPSAAPPAAQPSGPVLSPAWAPAPAAAPTPASTPPTVPAVGTNPPSPPDAPLPGPAPGATPVSAPVPLTEPSIPEPVRPPLPGAIAGPSRPQAAPAHTSQVPAEERNAEPEPGLGGPAQRQEPAVALEWGGPSTVRIGQPAEYTVAVRNTCPIPVQQVLVRVRIPAGMSLAGTEPKALVEGNVVAWELGTLTPRQEQNLQMRLVAETHGDLVPQAWVTFTGTSVMRVLVREPRLQLRTTPPERLQIGDTGAFVLTVTNPGDGPAEQIKIHARFSDGLEHPTGSVVDFEIGNLTPGESRNVQLICTARAGGEQKCDVSADADGGLKAQDHAILSVRVPRLELHAAGPGLRYVERKAVYTVRVTNAGDAPANNVLVSDVLPDGLKFVTASDGGHHDPATRAVSWFLGEISPGLTREVKLELLAVNPGEQRQRAVAQAARGLKVEADVATRVESLSALSLEVADTEDPVEVGADTTYEVRVSNTGSKTETNIRLACTLPDKVEFKGAQGPGAYHVEGRTITFDPVAQLTPRADVLFHVQVKAQAAGDARFKAQVSSANLVEPLAEMKVTHVYSDGR